jgi:TRAP-type C4-dicarboxylate transport system permease small subunit
MGQVRRLARRLIIVADHIIGWLLVATIIINAAAVFMRYVMLDSISWSEEAIRYLGVWITFLGAASASWADEHMDMNMLGEFGGAGFQAVHKSVLQALALVFGAIVAWQGVRYTMLSGLQTAPTTGMPMFYVYSAIAIGGALIALVAIVKIADQVWPPADPAQASDLGGAP